MMERETEMVRSFLAFEISDLSKDWIEERKRGMMRNMKGNVRWVKRDALHVTLHFFGKIPLKAIKRVGEIFVPLAAGFQPFTLSVKGIGAFPNRRKPRVLWARIEELGEKSQLNKFYATMQVTLEKEGFPVERRTFMPHVTIGRVKKPIYFDWESLRDLPFCPPFTVKYITFFRSDLTPEGPLYQPLNRFSLGGVRYD